MKSDVDYKNEIWDSESIGCFDDHKSTQRLSDWLLEEN